MRLASLGKYRRGLLTFGIALVVLVVAAAVALPRLIDVNTYRPIIEARASEKLGRRVTFGAMELRVFPRLAAVLHDVTVEGLDREGKSVLTASAVRANARLWPLLTQRRLDVTALDLEKPDLALVRDSTGVWNWQRMLERRGPRAEAGPHQSSFTMNDLGAAGATVRVIDDAAEPGRSVSYQLRPIDFHLRNYRPGHRFDLDVDGTMIAEEGQ